MFVSQASVSPGGAVPSYNLKKQIEVVKNCRKVTKRDLKFNTATPALDVDPDSLVKYHAPVLVRRQSTDTYLGCYLRRSRAEVHCCLRAALNKRCILLLRLSL